MNGCVQWRKLSCSYDAGNGLTGGLKQANDKITDFTVPMTKDSLSPNMDGSDAVLSCSLPGMPTITLLLKPHHPCLIKRCSVNEAAAFVD